MNAHFSKQQIPAGNPLANALIVIVGALAIGASLILGVVAMVVLGSIVLVMAAIIGIRVWWLNRRLGRNFTSAKRATKSQQKDVIEGEFRVISNDQNTGRQTRE